MAKVSFRGHDRQDYESHGLGKKGNLCAWPACFFSLPSSHLYRHAGIFVTYGPLFILKAFSKQSRQDTAHSHNKESVTLCCRTPIMGSNTRPGKDLLFHRLGPRPRSLCPARPGALTATPAHRGGVQEDGGGDGARPRPRRPVHLALTLTAGQARWRETPCPRARAAATQPPPKPRPPRHRHGNGAWGRTGDTLTYTRRRGRPDLEPAGVRPPSRPPSGHWSCLCRNPRRPSPRLPAPPAAAAHLQPSDQHAVRRHFVHWQRWSRAAMASRSPFDISGARDGEWPAGPGRETSSSGRGSSAATRASLGGESLQIEWLQRRQFISASSGFFPLGGDALAVSALTPARTRGRCSGEGSAAAPGGYRFVMAKHHPDLIFCRKQAGVGETQGVGEWEWREPLRPFSRRGVSERRARASGPVTVRGARPRPLGLEDGMRRRRRGGTLSPALSPSLSPSLFNFPFLLFSFYFDAPPSVTDPAAFGSIFLSARQKLSSRYPVIRITGFILVASESELGSKFKDLLHGIRSWGIPSRLLSLLGKANLTSNFL